MHYVKYVNVNINDNFSTQNFYLVLNFYSIKKIIIIIFLNYMLFIIPDHLMHVLKNIYLFIECIKNYSSIKFSSFTLQVLRKFPL